MQVNLVSLRPAGFMDMRGKALTRGFVADCKYCPASDRAEGRVECFELLKPGAPGRTIK